MNRRSFLKSLVAAAVATQCPLPALSVRPSASEIVWAVERFDFGNALAVCATVGNKRHAVWMPSCIPTKEKDVAFLKRELVFQLREKGWIA